MTNAPKTTIAAMLAVALSAAPLAACGNSPEQGGADETVSEQAQEQTQEQAQAPAQTEAIDVASWKTLGDALAHDAGENSSAGWDEQHYIAVFTTTGGSVVRVVAAMDEATYNAHAELEMSDDDYEQKFLDLMGGLPLESAEDLTSQALTAEEVDAWVGKTGGDLAADGYAFESYWMYGGEQTGATYAKGLLAYNVTFDATISDDEADSDWEGAAVKDALIASVEFAGASMAATDPANV